MCGNWRQHIMDNLFLQYVSHIEELNTAIQNILDGEEDIHFSFEPTSLELYYLATELEKRDIDFEME